MAKKRFTGVLDPTPTTETPAQAVAAAPVLTTALQYKGFNKGLSQVLHVDYSTVIGELREALGVNSRAGLSLYRNGKIRLRADQAARIQEVFNRRDITEIWDA